MTTAQEIRQFSAANREWLDRQLADAPMPGPDAIGTLRRILRPAIERAARTAAG